MLAALSVCVSVCLSVGHEREPAKTAEPIDISSGRWTRGPKKLCILGGARILHGRGTGFRG